MKTLEQRLVESLIKRGWSEIASRSKYRTFAKHGVDDLIFIGSKGAMRAGFAVSTSHSMNFPKGQPFYTKLLNETPE